MSNSSHGQTQGFQMEVALLKSAKVLISTERLRTLYSMLLWSSLIDCYLPMTCGLQCYLPEAFILVLLKRTASAADPIDPVSHREKY